MSSPGAVAGRYSSRNIWANALNFCAAMFIALCPLAESSTFEVTVSGRRRASIPAGRRIPYSLVPTTFASVPGDSIDQPRIGKFIPSHC